MLILERVSPKIARREGYAWAAVLLVIVIGLLSVAVDSAFHLAPLPIDGTFHLFNPIRRIALGQSGGVDYQNYHGIVLPYLYYPFVKLGHFTLFGLELTRHSFTAVALVLSYVFLFDALTGSIERTARLSAVALIASIALGMLNILTPGSSEFGVRTFFPVVFAAFLGMPSDQRSYRLRALGEGLFLGLLVAISSEQGAAMALSYALVALIDAARSDERMHRLIRLGAVTAVAICTFALILMMIGGPRGLVNALRYNFVAVPEDQYWYFGAVPSAFLRMWSQLLIPTRIPLVLAAGLANAVFWIKRLARRRVTRPPRAIALAVLSTYGVLSAAPLLARWIGGYTDNTLRVLLISVLYVVDVLVARRWRVPGRWIERRLWVTVFVAFAVVAAAARWTITRSLIAEPAHLVSRHVIAHDTVELAKDWQLTLAIGNGVIDRNRLPDGSAPFMWSTYSGVFEAITGSVNPAFDYAIDALGHVNRPAYLETFLRTKPQIVQTTNPVYTPFEEWLEVTTWPLYRELLTDYKVGAVSPFSVFWERQPTAAGAWTPLFDWTQPPGGKQTVVGLQLSGGTGFYVLDVAVDYEISNPFARFPILANLPRYSILTRGAENALPVPLAPYRTTATFPVIMHGPGRLAFEIDVQSLLPGPQIRLKSVRIRGLGTGARVSPWLMLFHQATLRTHLAQLALPR